MTCVGRRLCLHSSFISQDLYLFNLLRHVSVQVEPAVFSENYLSFVITALCSYLTAKQKYDSVLDMAANRPNPCEHRMRNILRNFTFIYSMLFGLGSYGSQVYYAVQVIYKPIHS